MASLHRQPAYPCSRSPGTVVVSRAPPAVPRHAPRRPAPWAPVPAARGRYGRWLRRQRRVADSRAPLRTAREGLDALAFPRLAESARQELRASGETSRRRIPAAWDQLTPQELQIARLAAAGFSNREIGEQLYITHRTVGYHLHKVFTKLGLASRGQLHAVGLGLTASDVPSPTRTHAMASAPVH